MQTEIKAIADRTALKKIIQAMTGRETVPISNTS